MSNWRVELREQSEGWIWECFDAADVFVCKSKQRFRRRWQALRDFDYMYEDHWASMRATR